MRHLLGNIIVKTAFIFSVLFLYTIQVEGQVTIGDTNPPEESAVLEIKTDNKGFLGPQVELKSIYDKIAIPAAPVGLLVLNTKDSDPEEITAISERVRAHRYYYWTGARWVQVVGKQLLRANIEEILAKMGIPRPAIFLLDGTDKIFITTPPYYEDMRGVVDLLKGVAAGSTAYVPLREHVNYTGGTVTMSTTGSGNSKQCTITFQPGIYNISFVYEFIPANYAQPPVNTNDRCTASSYFMNFPVTIKNADGTMTTGVTRVESNNSQTRGDRQLHRGDYSDHGNTINYVAVLLQETNWEVKMGTGYEANTGDGCEGTQGYAMSNRSTCLFISRIGDTH